MDLARIRKAITAGAGATVAALWAALVNGDKPHTPEGWGALIGGAIALGVVTGIGTYAVRNARTVNGSDPVYDLGDVARGDVRYARGQVPPPRQGREDGL